MLQSTRSTADPSASFASLKPLPRGSAGKVCGRRFAGQSSLRSSSRSMATTCAPRRSISNAQKPSQVPTSRARIPSIRSGSP